MSMLLLLLAQVTGPPSQYGAPQPSAARYGALPVASSVQPASSGGVATIPHGLVSFQETVPVPALVSGPLVEVSAVDGAAVAPDELLAQIDDSEARAARDAALIELQSARLKAENDIEVQYADAAYRLADIEHAKAVEINSIRPDTVPASEVRRLDLAKHRAKLYIEKAALEQNVSKMAAELRATEVQAGEDAVARRRIVSPLGGTVIAVLKQKGDWVDAGEPVAQVARMDRLRIEGRLSGAEFDPGDVDGRPVTVTVDLARGHTETLTGRLVLVSSVAQAGNIYRVRAEVENRQLKGQWILRPGMTVTMKIDTASR